jgi:exopolysaccharide production protein ExoY
MSSSLARPGAESALVRRAADALRQVDAAAPASAQIIALDVNPVRYTELAVEHLERARQTAPTSATRSDQFGRAFECVLAAVLILVFSPLMIVVTLFLMRRGGTPFFGHRRLGKNGQIFRCLKFRTMKVNAESLLQDVLKNDPLAREQWRCDHKLKNDPRITRLGGYLRRSSLDELPQLINVFRGEMSLVGPRPIVIDEIYKYGARFGELVSVRPGITGLWQVSGRNDITYRRRKALDVLYIRKKSFGFDLKILLMTVSVVLKRCGAY